MKEPKRKIAGVQSNLLMQKQAKCLIYKKSLNIMAIMNLGKG